MYSTSTEGAARYLSHWISGVLKKTHHLKPWPKVLSGAFCKLLPIYMHGKKPLADKIIGIFAQDTLHPTANDCKIHATWNPPCQGQYHTYIQKNFREPAIRFSRCTLYFQDNPPEAGYTGGNGWDLATQILSDSPKYPWPPSFLSNPTSAWNCAALLGPLPLVATHVEISIIGR